MKRKSINKKIRFEVFKRDNFTCQYCGKSAPNVILEIDHITPVSKGGNNDLIIDRFNGYFVNSYKDVPNKIYYLNLEKQLFNRMRINAFKTINKNFLKKQINQNIFNIIKNYLKQ